MGCREFFEAHANDGEKCKALQGQPEQTNLEWEKQSASEHSPSPVEDGENLVRYWLNPVHFDRATGELKPTAFEDASDKGLSVNRTAFVKLPAVEAMATARAHDWNAQFPAKPIRTLIGYSAFSAAEVRSIVTVGPPEGSRAFAVFDTAKPDDISHADVCQIVTTAQGARSARSQMRVLANQRLASFDAADPKGSPGDIAGSGT